jgi:hypothetical protein
MQHLKRIFLSLLLWLPALAVQAQAQQSLLRNIENKDLLVWSLGFFTLMLFVMFFAIVVAFYKGIPVIFKNLKKQGEE